jgi:hypothetical protein
MMTRRASASLGGLRGLRFLMCATFLAFTYGVHDGPR